MIFDYNKGFDDDESFDFAPKPIIAISANIINENSALHFAYSEAIVNSGGVPLIVPANCSGEALVALMRSVDGVLYSGGDDIDAQYFGEENVPNLTDISQQRDYYEFMFLRAAIDCSVPILGICRGCQLLNIAFGGTIYQDLPSMFPTKPLQHSVLENKHLPVHSASVNKESLLYKIVGKESIDVNSRHHQALKDIAEQFKINSVAPDGAIEGVEAYPNHKIIAVQCHPENLATTGGNIEMQKLFKFFVSEANLYRKAREIHQQNVVIDSHCDTPMLYEKGGLNFAIRNSGAQVDLVKMTQGYVDATITVAYISQKTPKEIVTTKAFDILHRFKSDIAKLSEKIVVCKMPQEVLEAKQQGLKSVLLALENGVAIGDDLSNIDKFREEGVVYITLCHNGSNQICDSAVGKSLYNGVSSFGKEAILRMNSCGITVDVSHSSEKSTMDALAISQRPIIASHSSCKALCNHPRNLSDRAIELIAAKGGVVQVCCYDSFLTKSGIATIHNVVEHIEHIISLVGYDFAGVGSDFDGGGGVVGLNGANDFINISVELLRKGHKAKDIAKIMGGNILRVLSQNRTSVN